MNKIDFSKWSLSRLFALNDFDYLKFSNERNVSHSRNIKQLKFFHNLQDNEVEILVQLEEVIGGIDISIIFENICRNIPIEDSIFECIIIEISRVAFLIKEHLELEFLKRDENLSNTRIIVDTMCVDYRRNKELKESFDSLNIKEKLYQLHQENIPNVLRYENYPNDLFVFGTTGKLIAEILLDLSLAKFKKTHSGYLIEFIHEYAQNSSEFIKTFSIKLNEIGVPSMAIPLSILDSLW